MNPILVNGVRLVVDEAGSGQALVCARWLGGPARVGCRRTGAR